MADVAALTLKVNSSQAERNVNTMDKALSRLDMTAKQVGRNIKSLGLKLSAAVTAPLALTAGAAVKASAGFEKARISFGVFINDMERGAQVFDDIVQLASKTPLNVGSLQQAAQVLLATGAATADTLIPMLRSLGDISRADSAILQRLALNLGQVASQGKLTGRELRDFAVAGVPLLQQLAKQMGKTTAEIQDMVSKGQVGFDDVLKAFRSMSGEGGKFNQLMSRLANTLGGRWTTAVDNVVISLANMADLFRTELKIVLDFVISVAQRFDQLSTPIKKTIAVLAGIASALGPILIVIGSIITGVVAIKAAFAFLGIAIVPILAIMGKILVVIGIIAAAAEGLRRVFGLTWTDIGNRMLNFAQVAIGFFVNFRENWGKITQWLGDNWRNVLADMLANSAMLWLNLSENVVKAVNLMAGLLGAFTGWVMDNWKDMLSGLGGLLLEWAVEVGRFFFQLGQEVIQRIKDGLTGRGFEDIDIVNRFIEGSAQNRSATLAERLQNEVDKVKWRPLDEGFQRTTTELPIFNTTFKIWRDLIDKTPKAEDVAAGVRGGAESLQDQAPSTKLASALEAGSSEAFKLFVNQRDPGQKIDSKNLDANQRTAMDINKLTTNGVKIQGLKTVGSLQ